MYSKLYYYLIFLMLTACSLQSTDEALSSTIDWSEAQWIGLSSIDERPQEWRERTIVRNRPPHDISTWQPTAKDFEGRQASSFLSPLLRKAFVTRKKIRNATVAVSGLGLYELYLNGNKVGDQVLAPAQTSYNKRVFYNVYDVTTMLETKKNVIGLMLGNGFYGQNMALGGRLYYGTPKALLVLTLTYNDGSQERIVSDHTWKANSGPVLYDNIYLGESYDARKEIKGWSTVNLDDKNWFNADTLKAPGGQLLQQELEPMRKIREVHPIAILPAEKGWIIDMGQNMTGWLHLSLQEKAGTSIKIQYAEHLMPDKQNIDPASTGIHVTGSVQTDYYICKGGAEEWEPRFTYHGFRYAQIEGLSQRPDLSQFTGWLVRTDMARIGSFQCSDSLINKFYEVSMWTIEDNVQGLLSDCPHRERCAWMGDAYVVAEAASFNFDMLKMWRKSSADMQTVLGVEKAHFKDPFPYDKRAPGNISVGKRLCLQARPDWGAATVMLPWYTYLYYGDKQIIAKAWDMMAGWLAYLDEKVQVNGVIDGGYGDWCPPGGNKMMDTPPALTSTALYYQSLIAMYKMGTVLEKENIQHYAETARRVKEAFNQRFLDPKKMSYGSQTGDAFALFSEIVPKGQEQAIADDLANIIMTDHKGYYSTGIFGHRALYTVLNDYGHADVVQHLWQLTNFPSLGFLTEVHGLTTWPEVPVNWTPGKRYWRNSFNHPMNSGFAATFHESLGGIRPNEDYPGFEKFTLKPTFLPGLDWAKVSHRSPKGEIKSCWNRDNKHIVWQVTIPAGSIADIDLRAYSSQTISVDGKAEKNKTFVLPQGEYQIKLR